MIFPKFFASATISENAAVGQSVVQVTATDADTGSNAQITFRIISGDDQGEDLFA